MARVKYDQSAKELYEEYFYIFYQIFKKIVAVLVYENFAFTKFLWILVIIILSSSDLGMDSIDFNHTWTNYRCWPEGGRNTIHFLK